MVVLTAQYKYVTNWVANSAPMATHFLLKYIHCFFLRSMFQGDDLQNFELTLIHVFNLTLFLPAMGWTNPYTVRYHVTQAGRNRVKSLESNQVYTYVGTYVLYLVSYCIIFGQLSKLLQIAILSLLKCYVIWTKPYVVCNSFLLLSKYIQMKVENYSLVNYKFLFHNYRYLDTILFRHSNN